MDAKKVEGVTSQPTPTNKKEVQSFLNFANFYRKFIKGYSKVASPLTDLTRNETVFHQTKKAEEAFCKLKKLFTS